MKVILTVELEPRELSRLEAVTSTLRQAMDLSAAELFKNKWLDSVSLSTLLVVED